MLLEKGQQPVWVRPEVGSDINDRKDWNVEDAPRHQGSKPGIVPLVLAAIVRRDASGILS
jgi:hypothetical protein